MYMWIRVLIKNERGELLLLKEEEGKINLKKFSLYEKKKEGKSGEEKKRRP